MIHQKFDNPYAVQLPAMLAFSGGRTSAYMLHQTVDAFGGKLPDGLHVVFFNTGKERQETYDFVRECGQRWGVQVTWLEYDSHPMADGRNRQSFKIVAYETAARNGEPFQAVIDRHSGLPNPLQRYCTQELKVRVGMRFMASLGYEYWTEVLGIRADEDHRNPKPSRAKNTVARPMVDAGIAREDVLAFWATQDFDLGLSHDEGNCDLCFLKGKSKLVQLMVRRPQDAEWWINNEDRKAVRWGRDSLFSRFGRRYRYSEIMERAMGGELFAACDLSDPEIDDCHCTD